MEHNEEYEKHYSPDGERIEYLMEHPEKNNQPIDEKCCEKCWDLSLSDDTRTCFITDCPCHKSESIEWEKEVNDFRNGVQDAPDTDEYIRENLPRVLSQAITTAVETKEKSVIEILERHASWKPTEGHGSEEELGFQKGLMAEAKLIKSEILSIINPYKE